MVTASRRIIVNSNSTLTPLLLPFYIYGYKFKGRRDPPDLREKMGKCLRTLSSPSLTIL